MRPVALKRLIVICILILWGFISIYPLLWMIGASSKEPNEVLGTYSLFPAGDWNWTTYVDVWNRLSFFKYFWNSVIVAMWTLLFINLFYSLAGFAFAKVRFPGKSVAFYGFLGMMFVPGITVLVPLYLTEHYLGLLNTHLGLILPAVNAAAPIAIFLFRNYFSTIPHAIFESAKVEGAGILRILIQIYLPLAVPAMVTITVLNFLAVWNSLVLPMTILRTDELFTLPLAVNQLDTGVFRQWNVLMAGALISILPAIIGFAFLQRYYIQGLSAGAVKL